jgi:putative zinc finger/helix-turn-helix YgiT family protein
MNKRDSVDKGRIDMQTVAFGYKCQECGQGTVLEKIVPEYKTKLKGYPLTVEDARIGVCDRCGAEHFDPNETMRWRSLLEEKQGESYLQPAEIRELRKQFGLPMEQFATLIGCTRQSLYNWERTDRRSPQSRMADIFMRLIRESHLVGSVNVLAFLTSEAEKLGIHLAVAPKANPVAPIIMMPRKAQPKLVVGDVSEPLALAADTEAPQEEVVMVAQHDQQVAKLF